jgi:hypothetical protein
VKEADKARDQALKNLRRDIGKEKDTALDVAKVEANVRELLQLQERIDVALNSCKSGELLTVSREMTFGRGSAESVKQLTSINVGSCERYEMTSGSRSDLQKHVNDFIGSPKCVSTVSNNVNNASGSGAGGSYQKVTSSSGSDSTQSTNVNEAASGSVGRSQISIQPAERVPTISLDVNEAFDSGGRSQDTRVFSLFHVDQDPPFLFVSYERYIDDTNALLRKFREGGGCLYENKYYKGMVSFDLSKGVFKQSTHLYMVYALTQSHWWLKLIVWTATHLEKLNCTK